jgi:hypothetical protein
MRVFGLDHDGKLQEYVRTPFHTEHVESALEDWLEENPDGIMDSCGRGCRAPFGG